jgi:hypothetical protein
MPLNQRTINIVDAPQLRFSTAIALIRRDDAATAPRAARAATGASYLQSNVAVTPDSVKSNLKQGDITTYFQSIQATGQTPMYFSHFRQSDLAAKFRFLPVSPPKRRPPRNNRNPSLRRPFNRSYERTRHHQISSSNTLSTVPRSPERLKYHAKSESKSRYCERSANSYRIVGWLARPGMTLFYSLG